MFPRDFFIDYWNPGLRDELFVAMPFESKFDQVWENAIMLAAKACGLKPFRVDLNKTSDSILVDILDGVAHARLVFVDVSPVSCPPAGRIRALVRGVSCDPVYPNGNVMYELGLAHSTRQAEEVIVVRNHAGARLLFDVSGVRVHTYSPNDLTATSGLFEALIREALTIIDRTKALQVAKAIQAITIDDIKLIRKWWPYGFTIFSKQPDGDMKGIPSSLTWAAANLQKLGVLHVNPLPEGKFSLGLVWTEFGHAVVKALGPRVIQGRPDPAKSQDSANTEAPTSGDALKDV
jgi:hypothetical protein